jgi:hypothetical protein
MYQKPQTWIINGADLRLRFGPESAVLLGGEACFPIVEDFTFGFERTEPVPCTDQ